MRLWTTKPPATNTMPAIPKAKDSTFPFVMGSFSMIVEKAITKRGLLLNSTADVDALMNCKLICKSPIATPAFRSPKAVSMATSLAFSVRSLRRMSFRAKGSKIKPPNTNRTPLTNKGGISAAKVRPTTSYVLNKSIVRSRNP